MQKILGIMSGTSLDGIDVALCSFSKDGNAYTIHDCQTIPYSKAWQKKLSKTHALSAQELIKLDRAYGNFLGTSIKKWLTEKNANDVACIASHGHTVFHQPENGFTLQIGHGGIMAEVLQLPVINDFRQQDIANGGQGAPLVPIGDRDLFSEHAVCINLGGFANYSKQIEGKRIAADICALNTVFNALAHLLGQPYDHGGQIAKSGKVDNNWLKTLNNLPFYKLKAPKSLGVEWGNTNLSAFLHSTLSVADKMATFSAHAAIQISGIIKNCSGSVLFSGGGAYNAHLMQQIEHLTKSTLPIAEKQIVEFKEALIFAYLGWLRLQNNTNVLSSATGAKKDSCAGAIWLPS